MLRVVLEVDGVLVSSDSSPDPNGAGGLHTRLHAFAGRRRASGTHTVMVTAFRADGIQLVQNRLRISVTVAESMADQCTSTIATTAALLINHLSRPVAQFLMLGRVPPILKLA